MSDAEVLRDHGLRVTRPRLAVLDAVGNHPHADTERLVTEVRGTLPTVSVQGVYDVLRALTAAGLVRRIEPAGHPARYERRVADNHHHVVCRACGALRDIDCVVGAAPCLEPSSGTGYTVETAEVTFWGLCPSCQATA
ncbi:Fur family transcriptional regulator [Pengzhenrongella sicca]|uniref:Transcriptional repressor n=1 Tax=Pengzhenrongella sicca TaxID=2819238 RepID=A0A8A4ZJK8_9MICO|nr:Fur family transcriptional regulator [Pengzhenrongella sicca]QTE30686.1 transcriptional repressor [Pengzhenrongella sicca]